jgi:hypothetical protein
MEVPRNQLRDTVDPRIGIAFTETGQFEFNVGALSKELLKYSRPCDLSGTSVHFSPDRPACDESESGVRLVGYSEHQKTVVVNFGSTLADYASYGPSSPQFRRHMAAVNLALLMELKTVVDMESEADRARSMQGIDAAYLRKLRTRCQIASVGLVASCIGFGMLTAIGHQPDTGAAIAAGLLAGGTTTINYKVLPRVIELMDPNEPGDATELLDARSFAGGYIARVGEPPLKVRLPHQAS